MWQGRSGTQTDQDALVHVAVLHVQADPDDAAVVHLLVVQWQRQRRVVGHGRHRALVRAGGRQRRRAGHRGRGRAAGARRRTGTGARSRRVQRRQGRAFPELCVGGREQRTQIKHQQGEDVLRFQFTIS